MANQSSVFPIYLRAEYRNDGQGFSRFQSDAQRAAQAAKREFEGVRTALDAALSRPRNTAGSLDLGVEELKRAALAQQQIAAAAREVANATKAAASANGQFDAAMSRSTRAAFELANAEERVSREMMEQVAALEAVQRELNQTASATDLVTQANRRGTTANQNVINSQRASRTAFIQLGQQLQDVAVQAQMGTNAFLIFGQQAPQAAFALSGLADSANRTQRAIGNVATFLSGPWGAAVFVAVAALGPLVAKLFESEEAADASSRAQRSLAQVLGDTTSSYDELTKALRDYNREQERGQQTTLNTLKAQAAQIASNLETAASIRQKIKAELELFQAEVRRGPTGPGGQGQIGALAGANVLAGQLAQQEALIKELQAGARNTNVQLAVEFAKINTDSAARINATYDDLAEQAKKRFTDLEGLTARLTEIERQRKAALDADRASGRSDRSGAAAERRRIREVEQLAKFGEDAAETIKRLNERFDEQPRLIDAAAQATRQLDGIIADLEKRKPLGFEDLISQARDAKLTVEDALLRPIELIRQESEQRLAIEEALAAGQLDRAAALQEIFRLEQQIGILNDEQRADIEDIVVREQQRLRLLRDQQAVFNAQLDVLGTVRRDLTDILSGRSADFFGNFRRALQDLQGARLFESLFGQAFRDIENELQKSTPQGRANAAYVQQVERTASATERVGDAAVDLAEEFDRAFGIMRGGSFGAANDNGFSPRGTMAQAALDMIGLGGITVTGNRRQPVDISRLSVTDLAKRISDGIGIGIKGPLEEVLGPRFAALLGDVIGGFIAGKVTGGTPGGIIGALKGVINLARDKDGNLSKTLGSIDKALGKAGEGAAVGTQVAGLGKALGIKTSSLGGQIGGTIGSFIPIPGGQIIGAIAGSLLGGLLKSTPRASATIGGVGGGLGLTSVTGTSASLRDAASGLGGGVLETINRIAEQLGASVNASAGSVSIGQRKGNIRVDPRGGGVTKIGNGAIDFGQDSEAAIAFAVRDLIQDGVITGLRQSEQRLLRAGSDIQAALQDVLTFRSVFDRLLEIRDPVAFATQQVDREFDRLRDVFVRAGATEAEFADLAALKEIERTRAIQEVTDRVVGSLRQLLNDLRIGDNGLSLRDRRSNAVGQFDALAARVAAGDSTAFDDFADISRQLLDIERQLFGSTQAYFDRLNQVTTLTERAISGQSNVSPMGVLGPAQEQANIARVIESTGAEQLSVLRAINDNLILSMNPALRAVGGGYGGNGIAPMPAFRADQVLNF